MVTKKMYKQISSVHGSSALTVKSLSDIGGLTLIAKYQYCRITYD